MNAGMRTCRRRGGVVGTARARRVLHARFERRGNLTQGRAQVIHRHARLERIGDLAQGRAQVVHRGPQAAQGRPDLGVVDADGDVHYATGG